MPVAPTALKAAFVLAAASTIAYGFPYFIMSSAKLGCLTPLNRKANGPRNRSLREFRAAFACAAGPSLTLLVPRQDMELSWPAKHTPAALDQAAVVLALNDDRKYVDDQIGEYFAASSSARNSLSTQLKAAHDGQAPLQKMCVIDSSSKGASMLDTSVDRRYLLNTSIPSVRTSLSIS
jgi:hypothetical protein